jgi:hypothetical protein
MINLIYNRLFSFFKTIDDLVLKILQILMMVSSLCDVNMQILRLTLIRDVQHT